MRISVGADHRGFVAHERVVTFVRQLGHEVEDVGTYDENPVDYPDIAALVGRKVSRGEVDCGILVGRTGMGLCIVANKFPGVRAVTCHDEVMAEMSRRYLDVNVLCLSAELLGEAVLESIIRKWLEGSFEGGRHQRRIDKISTVEHEVAAEQELPQK